MPDVKSSTRELLWLYRLRQAVLFGADSLHKGLARDSPECDTSDCLPWLHSADECVNMRLREVGGELIPGETPVL